MSAPVVKQPTLVSDGPSHLDHENRIMVLEAKLKKLEEKFEEYKLLPASYDAKFAAFDKVLRSHTETIGAFVPRGSVVP